MNRCEGCNSDSYECNVCNFCHEHYYCDCKPCSCEDIYDIYEEYYHANATDINFYNYWKHESFGGYSE